jgi:hypothetical protein
VAGGACAGRLDMFSAWEVRSKKLPLFCVFKKCIKKTNHGPYKVGLYNSVPVVLHCNCYVLDRVQTC